MAVGVLIAMPGATQQLYDDVNEAMNLDPNDPPEGLILHSAGPMEGGWYVYDVWEKREDFDRFGREKVGPAVKQVTGSEMEGEPQFFEIANLILAGQTVA
ncbi:MAG TPA: hypothetical protein VGJ25_12750 [Gaiellaceae bacterium]